MVFVPPEACVAVRRTGTPNVSEDSNIPSEGVVVSVGPGSEFLPPLVKVGERVYFGSGSGFEIDFDDGTLVILAEAELLRETGWSCAPGSTTVSGQLAPRL